MIDRGGATPGTSRRDWLRKTAGTLVYLTLKPLMSVPWLHEKVVAGPQALACTPLSSKLPLSIVTP